MKRLYKIVIFMFVVFCLLPLNKVNAAIAQQENVWYGDRDPHTFPAENVPFWCDYRLHAWLNAQANIGHDYQGFDFSLVYYGQENKTSMIAPLGNLDDFWYVDGKHNSVDILTVCLNNPNSNQDGCKQEASKKAQIEAKFNVSNLWSGGDVKNFKCPTLYSVYYEAYRADAYSTPNPKIELYMSDKAPKCDTSKMADLGGYGDGCYVNQLVLKGSKEVNSGDESPDQPPEYKYKETLIYGGTNEKMCYIGRTDEFQNLVTMNFTFSKKSSGENQLEIQVGQGGRSPITLDKNKNFTETKNNGEFRNYIFIMEKEQISKIFLENGITSEKIYLVAVDYKSEAVDNSSLNKDTWTLKITTDLEYAKQYSYSEISKDEKTCVDLFWNEDLTPGDKIYGCEVIPSDIREWIKDTLNLVKYIALVLVIVLGILDFIKAAASGEADQMKKSGSSFLKRIIAVIILFLLPVIVELVLNLIEIYGADSTCLPE